jgi:hypothetical protein
MLIKKFKQRFLKNNLSNFEKIKKQTQNQVTFFGNFPIGTSYLALDGTVAKF